MDTRPSAERQARGPIDPVKEALNRRIDLHACRQHHQMLRYLFDRMPDREPLDAAAAADILERVTALLKRHLKLEDDVVYPALQNSANRSLAKSAKSYKLELGNVLTLHERFVRAWPDAQAIDAAPAAFLERWLAHKATIERRIEAEDRDLYAEAERYFSSLL